ncbi:MAG: hypothetical protein H9535_08590 [Ignavibacteria bacterium]|nr:hypothetical protein [Ignavibacteria bacterium]
MVILFVVHGSFAVIPAIYAQEPQWKVFGHLQESRTDFCAAAVGYGKVLVMGGFREQRGSQNHRIRGSVTNSCEMIDINYRRITSAPSMHSPHADVYMLQTRDSNVVIISGLNTDSTATPVCEMYDRKKNEWRVLGSLLIGRHQHSAAFLNDEEIIVVGGRAQFNYAPSIAEAEIFNIRTGSSYRIDDFPCKSETAVGVESQVLNIASPFFLGGRSGGGGSYQTADIYLYDTISRHWSCVKPLHSPARMSAMRLFDGRLLLSGGTVSWRQAEMIAIPNHNICIETTKGFSLVGTKIKPLIVNLVGQWNSEIVLFLGGHDEKRVNTNYTEWFDSRTGLSCVGPPMNDARAFFCSVSLPTFDKQGNQQKGCILAIGGVDAQNRSLSSIEILETMNPQLIDLPNAEIASRRRQQLLTSPAVIITLTVFILVLIAALLYLLFQVFIIRKQTKFSSINGALEESKI